MLWRALAEVDESRNLWIAFGEEGQELWSVSDEDLCGCWLARPSPGCGRRVLRSASVLVVVLAAAATIVDNGKDPAIGLG